MILTSVDLPAPFSPRRASTEPPTASRSTPWRTSTPPKDLRIWRAWNSMVMCSPAPCVGRGVSGLARRRSRVHLADVVLVDEDVLDVQLGRDFLAVEQVDHRRHDRLAVLLREI